MASVKKHGIWLQSQDEISYFFYSLKISRKISAHLFL